MKGPGTKSFGVVFTQLLEVLAILKGGAKVFHSLKGGRKKLYPVLGGGGGGGRKQVSLTHSIHV